MNKPVHNGVIMLCLLFLLLPFDGVAQERVRKILAVLKRPSKDHILVAAHRGDWRNAPENSLQAVKNCIAMGVDIVEIDVQMTKDRQVVLMHDKTLDRTTTGTGLVKDHTLDSLRKLRLKDALGVATRHGIPTLQEVLEVAKDHIVLFIDKAYYCLPEVYALIEKAGMEEQCLFEGKVTIQKFRQDYPGLYNKVRYMPRVKEGNVHPFVNDYLDTMHPAAFIITYATEQSPVFPLIHQLNTAGIPVLVSTLWTQTCAGHDDEAAVEDPDASWGWVVNHGANIICTDRPAMMLSYLKKKGKHP